MRKIATLVLLTSAVAAQSRPTFLQLAGSEVDESIVFDGPVHGTKDDRRQYLCQFGIRPSLIVVPSRGSDPGNTKALVRKFKRLDQAAGRWRKRGVEVLCMHPAYTDPKAAARQRRGKQGSAKLDLARRVRPRNMALVMDSWDSGYMFLKRRDATSTKFYTARQKGSLVFYWLLMLEPGKISAAGEDVYGPQLAQALSRIEPDPLAADFASRKLLDAIACYRFEVAAKGIAALLKKQAEASAKAFQARLDQAVGVYDKVVVQPYEAAGQLPGYVEALEYSARRHWRGKGQALAILADARRLRETPRFAEVDAQRKAYQLLQALEEKQDKALWQEYEKLNKSGGYDAELARKLQRSYHKTTLSAYAAFLKKYPESPYRRQAAVDYMSLKEDL